MMDDLIKDVERVFAELGLHCAYDRPGFWCHGGKDYVVIDTKYHRGYDDALEDARKRVMDILEEYRDGRPYQQTGGD